MVATQLPESATISGNSICAALACSRHLSHGRSWPELSFANKLRSDGLTKDKLEERKYNKINFADGDTTAANHGTGVSATEVVTSERK